MARRHFRRFAIVFMYACATLQAARYYANKTDFYLRMSAYLNGHERLPFQQRVLPILFLRLMYGSSWVVHHFHRNGAFTAARGPFYVLSLISLVVAAIYTQKLYEALTAEGALRALVYPILLFTVLWTYAIHIEANFSYPYDLPSLAFFTAGLYFIYTRQFVPLLLTVLAGTFNRETTMFLVVIYVLDWASVEPSARESEGLAGRFNLRLVPWLRVALLTVIWLAIHYALRYVFRANDRSEDLVRWSDNWGELTPRLLPALLNICGYTLPIVLLYRKRLRPERFQNYLLVLPLWLLVMFCAGVLVETRIYGELCSYSAVALVLILEDGLAGAADERRVRREARSGAQLRAGSAEMTTT